MTVSQLRSDLQGSREQLFSLIRGLSEEQFRYAPETGAWPIAAHLAHLLRTERLFVGRARLALDEDEPRLPSTRVLNDDDPGLAQRLAVPQIIHGMQASHRELDELLARCDDAALLRVMHHERLGRMTVREVAVKMAEHEREHTEAVAQVLRQVPSGGRVIIPLTRRSIG